MSNGLFSFYFGGSKLVPFLTNIEHTCNAIQDALGETLSSFYPFQSISMPIQRGNAVCVMGCPKEQSTGLEGLFNFQVHEAEELR